MLIATDKSGIRWLDMAIYQTTCSSFKLELLNGVHAFGTTVARATTAPDTFKMALYTANASLDANTLVYTTTDEVVGTGYTAGGVVLTTVAPILSGTTACVSFDPAIWSPAEFTARGALIYNASQGDKVVAVLNFGSDKTATSTFTVTFPPDNADNAIVRVT